MPISSIEVVNIDHFAKGGLKLLEIAEVGATGCNIAVDDATNTATGVLSTTAANIKSFEFEKESAKMTISTQRTDSLNLYTVTVEGFVPKLSKARLNSLESVLKAPNGFFAKAYLWEDYDAAGVNANPYLLGFDNVLAQSSLQTDFPCVLESMEVDSGSALADANGVTVKVSCVMAAFPAQF